MSQRHDDEKSHLELSDFLLDLALVALSAFAMLSIGFAIWSWIV